MTFDQLLENRDEICAKTQGWRYEEHWVTGGGPEMMWLNPQGVRKPLPDYSKPDNWTKLRQEAIDKDAGVYSSYLIEQCCPVAHDATDNCGNPIDFYDLEDIADFVSTTPDQMCFAAAMVLNPKALGVEE